MDLIVSVPKFYYLLFSVIYSGREKSFLFLDGVYTEKAVL